MTPLSCIQNTKKRTRTPLPLYNFVPQRYCCHLRQHPPVQNKSGQPKKFLQKIKSGVTFAPFPFTYGAYD